MRELPMPEDMYGARSSACTAPTCTPRWPMRCRRDRSPRQEARRTGAARSRVHLSFEDGTRPRQTRRSARTACIRWCATSSSAPRAESTKGRIAYRAVFDSSRLGDMQIAPRAANVGAGPAHRHLLHRKDRSQALLFVTSVPEPADWITPESWSAKGEVDELPCRL